ncbi:MAG: hypothetical protein ACI3Z7_00925 [Candidatus Aphodosoma sp.]
MFAVSVLNRYSLFPGKVTAFIVLLYVSFQINGQFAEIWLQIESGSVSGKILMYDEVVVPQYLVSNKASAWTICRFPYGNGLTGMGEWGGGYLTDSATVVGMVIPCSQKAWCSGFAGYNDAVHNLTICYRYIHVNV